MKFLEWIKKENETSNKDNIFMPPIEPQIALNFLCDYLLGEDWYTVNPVSQKQVNTEIVENILYKYSGQYRKELKEERNNETWEKKSLCSKVYSLFKLKIKF